MPHKFIDLAGQRFGKWTVLAHPERSRTGRALWPSRCDCGVERVVRGDALRRGKSTSCGCTRCKWDEERREKQRQRRKKHGLSRSRAYVCWAAMMQRCFNPNNKAFADYGGRGIAPCDEWRGFENFFADMGDPPPSLSIHRIDNDGNYEPGNCSWAPPSVQISNRRHRPINLDKLKQRIAIGGPIRRQERGFLLDCINAYAPPRDAAGNFTLPPF